MTRSLVGIELETGGVLLKYVKTAAESGGAVHVQEARYPPSSTRPPLHRHPRQEEHFRIVQGALQFRVGESDRLLNAGEELSVPVGALHSAYNPGSVQTLVIWGTRPALRTAEFFLAMDRATRGPRGQRRPRPRLTDAAAILNEYRDEFQLAKPSPLIQRIVFGCLAPLGRAALGPTT